MGLGKTRPIWGPTFCMPAFKKLVPRWVWFCPDLFLVAFVYCLGGGGTAQACRLSHDNITK